MVRLGALLFLAIAPATPSRIHAAEPPPPATALSIWELSKRSPGVEVTDVELLAAIALKPNPERTVKFAAVLPLDGGERVTAWSDCDHTRCRGAVGVLRSGKMGWTLRRTQPLPAPPKVFAVDGLVVQGLALLDVTGDGKPELLVDYLVAEPPRAVLGSLNHQYYAVYQLPELGLAWSYELRRSGGAVEPVCEWQVASAVAAKAPATLTATGGCQPGFTSPDHPPPAVAAKQSKRFIWQPTKKRFLSP